MAVVCIIIVKTFNRKETNTSIPIEQTQTTHTRQHNSVGEGQGVGAKGLRTLGLNCLSSDVLKYCRRIPIMLYEAENQEQQQRPAVPKPLRLIQTKL